MSNKQNDIIYEKAREDLEMGRPLSQEVRDFVEEKVALVEATTGGFQSREFILPHDMAELNDIVSRCRENGTLDGIAAELASILDKQELERFIKLVTKYSQV